MKIAGYFIQDGGGGKADQWAQYRVSDNYFGTCYIGT